MQKKQPSRDSTRDRILIEAGKIFARKGFRATTVREISDAAEVNLASINYYFGDKKSLYIETVVLAREMRVQQVPSPKWAENTAPEEKLADFIRLILARLVAMKSEPWQVRLLMREILEPTDACRRLIEEYFRPFFEVLLTIVDDIVGVRLDDPVRQKIGFSIIGQCLYYRFAADLTSIMIGEKEYSESFDQEHLANHIIGFTLGAIESLKTKHHADQSKSQIAK